MMRIVSLLGLTLLILSCIQSSNTKISFKNESGQAIDSAFIFVNNYKVVFRNIKPDDVREAVITKKAVKTNPHDVTVTASLINHIRRPFTGGLFYTDLRGELDDQYDIKVGKDLVIKIQ